MKRAIYVETSPPITGSSCRTTTPWSNWTKTWARRSWMKPGGSISSVEMVLTCGYAPDFDMGLSENRLNPYTQWFCWSLSRFKMAISLEVYPIFRHTHMIFGKLRMKRRPHMVITCSWRTLNPAYSVVSTHGCCSIFRSAVVLRLSLSHLSGSGNLASMPLS